MTTPTTSAAPQTDGYVAYEYTKARTPKGLEALAVDTYRSFGWSLQSADSAGPNTLELNLRRDRSIRNRPMVQELQRKALTSLGTIAKLEQAKTTVPLAVAIVLGILGCIPLAAAVFMITGTAAGFLSTVLGIVGLVLWGAGFLAYLGIKASRTPKLDIRIDREQDVIFEAGEQAARLLR